MVDVGDYFYIPKYSKNPLKNEKSGIARIIEKSFRVFKKYGNNLKNKNAVILLRW